MKRDYPDRPLLAVGAVVLSGDSVLLIRRAKPPRIGEWSLPGGAVELGERMEDAIRREVREETGLRLGQISLLDAIDYIDRDEDANVAHHYGLIDYVARIDKANPSAGGDVSDARFVPLKDLDQYELWDETRAIILQAANQNPRRHTLWGHVRTALIATAFGLGAYAVLWVLMALLRASGFQAF